MNKRIRVFSHRTSFTPVDDYAFVGFPPMMRPKGDEVHVSCTFTWDLPMACLLVEAWKQYYPIVEIGGPGAASITKDGFTPGLYVKYGVTFTTRGCNHHCPWCLVYEREGPHRTIDNFEAGYIIGDNNILQSPRTHIQRVFDMLKQQRRAAILSGGLEAGLVDDWVVDGLRGLRINQLFLACDTEGGLKPLKQAIARLTALPRDKLRCYVMIGYNGETLEQAENRLRAVWELGCLPFAQLYQPPERKKIKYSWAWRDLARTWSRPAAMKAEMKI